jgi:hypothetical protein
MATAFKLLCDERGVIVGVEDDLGRMAGNSIERVTVSASAAGLEVVEVVMYDAMKARCCWRKVGGRYVCVAC